MLLKQLLLPLLHPTVRLGLLGLGGNRPGVQVHVAASWRGSKDTKENPAFQGGCEVWRYLCRLVSTRPANSRHELHNLDQGPQPRAMAKSGPWPVRSQAAQQEVSGGKAFYISKCNNNRIIVHNKRNVLESSQNNPPNSIHENLTFH